MKKTGLLILLLGMVFCLGACKSEEVKASKGESTERKETAKMIENTEKETTVKETQVIQKNTVTISELTIKNGDSTIYGKIYTPSSEGKHPAIILSHGYNGTNIDFVNECKYYAENGYIAYAYDFRGGSVNSKSSLKSTEMTIFTEKDDVISVFNYISAMENVDASQIFLFGGSQGGLATALATEELKDKVKGMALYFPALCIPDNWRTTYPDTTKIPETNSFWGLTLGKNFFLSMHDFYVFDNIGSFDKDVLIIHGDKDAIVPLSYSEKAITIYKNAKLITLPGEGHGFTPTGANTAKIAVLNFLKEHTTTN